MFCRHSVKVCDFFIAKFLISGFVKVKNRMMSKRGESGPRDREYQHNLQSSCILKRKLVVYFHSGFDQ